MVALEITSMKNFMMHLLSGNTFDDFLLEEATISTSNTYTIDGHMNTNFYPPEERDTEHIPYAFRPWSDIKGMCFDLIKGKHTPLFFKFILQLKPEKAMSLLQNQPSAGKDATDEISPQMLSQMKALILNIRYDGSKSVLTTGTSYQTFVLSHEIDLSWDHYLCSYLAQKGIGYEKL